MKILAFAGFPMADTYTIIKAISKKKDYVIKEAKPKFLTNFAKKILETGETDDEAKAHELADKVWGVIEDNCAYGFNCVSGDTILKGMDCTVASLYNNMQFNKYAKRYAWSMIDNRFVSNQIVDIYKQPAAFIWRITTKEYRQIKATANHKFPTPKGIKKLCELKLGDKLYCWDANGNVSTEPIISIRADGYDVVYDIEMSGDVAHNFVTNDGIVTCNSAHAYCMAIDSVTIAYLKAHYPLEFYKCVLQRFTDKGDKDKVSLIKQEMMKRGFKLKEIKFGDDNRQFTIDKQNNCIVQTMASIKGMPKVTPQALYELGQQDISTRTGLYRALVDDNRINIKAIDILFKLDYFSKFAEPNRLITEFEIYKKFIDIKTINKEKFSPEFLDIVKTHSGKETAKQFSQLDNLGLVKDIIRHTPIKRTTTIDKIKYQLELLGYSTLSDPQTDPSYWIVMNIESNSFGQKFLTIYNVCYGVSRRYKCNRKFAASHEVAILDTIQCVFAEKERMKKNPDGSFVIIPNQKYIELKCWRIVDE